MAEDRFRGNVRSPRYATSRSLGFRGGSVGPGGNLQQPTFLEVEGPQPIGPARARAEELARQDQTAAPAQPAIADFSAMIPRPPTLASSIASSVGGAVAREGLKRAGQAVKERIDLAMNPPDFSTGANVGKPVPESSLRGVDLAAETAPPLTVESYDAWIGGEEFQGFPGGAGWQPQVPDFEGGMGGWTDIGGGWHPEVPDFEGGMSGWTDIGWLESAGSGFPYIGVGMNLARGNVKGAAGNAAGWAIGNAIAPGIGGAVGSVLGGLLGGGCFITEAVMAAGGEGDNAPELQTLRWFRDNVMLKTQEGQDMVRQYYEIAPLVVQAIMQRPDALQVLAAIKKNYIDRAVEAVRAGRHQEALQIYAAMMTHVTPLAAEAANVPAGNLAVEPVKDSLDNFASEAAMAAYNPEIANAAVNGSNLAQPAAAGRSMPAIGQIFARHKRY